MSAETWRVIESENARRWYTLGIGGAHEDIALRGEPCLTIEEARRRNAAWLRDTAATAEDIEACAQGYLAGWASALPAPKPVAPAWGPFPSAAEVTAHVARCEQYAHAGAPWMRRYVAFDGMAATGVEIVYLSVERGSMRLRRPTSGCTYGPSEREAASEWRPVDADGVAVERG